MKFKYMLTIVCLFASLTLTSAYAQDIWNGGTGNWSNAANWSTFSVPNGSTVDVRIDGGNPIHSVVTFDLSSGSIGTLLLDPDDALNIDGALTSYYATLTSGTLTIDPGGSLNNNGLLINYNAFYNNGGTLNNNSGGTLNNNSGGTLNNNGTINNNSGGTLNNYGTLDANFGISNSGTLNNYDTLLGIAFNSGTLNNYGTLNNNFDFSTGAIFNSGTLNNYDTVLASISNTGTWNNDGGAVIINYGCICNSGILNNYGEISADNGDSSNTGTLNNYGGIQLFDEGWGNSGTLNNYGTFLGPEIGDNTFNSGILNNYGTWTTPWTLYNGGTLNNEGMLTVGFELANGGTLNNFGTLENPGSSWDNSGMLKNVGILDNLGLISNEGTLVNLGTLNTGLLYNYSALENSTGGSLINNSYLENYGTISNAGTFVVAPGATLANDTSIYYGTGTYAQSAGSTVVDGTFFSVTPIQINGGRLSGSGLIQGDVMMGGTMSPGDSPGVLTIQGNYTQLARGTFFAELAGLTPGTQYDQLVVSGLATLDGMLDVVLLNGFVVRLGDSFVLMTFGSESGQFSMLDLPTLTTGEMWRLSYNATDLTLSVAPTPEPASLLLLGSGLLGAVAVVRRKIKL